MELIKQKHIEQKIYSIRDMQVMLDSDLAEMYQVETKVLNQAVKRNIERFPESFRFQLTDEEAENLRSQFVTSSRDHGGRRFLPFAFTEQGVAMLSAVLRSDVAVQVSIQIMQAFVAMRKFLLNNASIFQRLDTIELKQLKTDERLERIFKALEVGQPPPDKGVFFEGQVFDAYVFVADLIKKAQHSIVIIDNYVDETVLNLLTKRKKTVMVTIYTQKISKQLQQDLDKHNTQYSAITIKTLTNSHDRFLIIDNNHLYHFGASLKDLGKRWFAFSRMDSFVNEILLRLMPDPLQLDR